MEMWSFATQVNNEGVMSSVAVVLALLLQIVSGSLQLVPHGLGVCQSLLQERQLKSLSKNLSSEKTKGFIISPTLRLLREAVCLDGGAYAKRIVRARNFTFTSLGRNLEVGHTGDSPEDARKASVRTNAVRFFLSCLKYLHSDGRKELLSQKDLLSHLTFMMKSDPPRLVLEILDTLKTHVLMDDKIPREAKFRCFNTKTLMRFLALYSYSSTVSEGDSKTTVAEEAHLFLVYACATPGAGVLYPSTGLYPKETDDSSTGRKAPGVNDLGRDVWEGQFSDGIPVFNFVLSDFARKLRPWSSLKHNELLVAIFTAAPELIADYFLNNRSFTFEPKLSMTWIGYAAFLFNTMRIPLPASFGDRTRYARIPPPTSILLDNIIPLPINQKVLVRCLSPKSHLTSFFAMRILVVALEKLSAAIAMQEKVAAKNSTLWSEATRRLVDAFCQRIPDMKEIVRSYKSTPAEHVLQKTTASRLLRLYYEVIPRVALAANFDVSPFFVDVLKKLNEEDGNPGDKPFGHMELENLVSIASYSPGMRWFSKIDNLSDGVASSPFTALLRILYSSDDHAPSAQLRKVLTDVATENQLVSASTGLTPLLQALRCTIKSAEAKDMEAVWAFLDNCINRCGTSPIKYLDLLKADLKDGKKDSEDGSFTLLGVTMVEQLPFTTSSSARKSIASVAAFLSLYFNALYASQDNNALVRVLHRRGQESFSSHDVKMAKLGSTDQLDKLRGSETDVDEDAATKDTNLDKTVMDDSKLEELLHVPFADEDDTGGLVKWSSKNVEDLVEDGWAAGLIRLLSSSHINIRKEAHTNLLKMAAKIKESSYEEKEQVWLLLSELAESSKTQVGLGPVPSAFTAFAVHALDVLRNPLHPLYPKINAFLTRSPVWSLEKLPLAHDILHGEPSEDDKYYTELTWLLTYLLDSLRTPFDLGVFHKKRWFEKILALGSNPYLRFNLRTRILRIVYRAVCMDAGSTTLITRFGVLSWLDAQRASAEVREEAAVYEALMRRAWETCDQERVMAWSKGGVRTLVESVSQA